MEPIMVRGKRDSMRKRGPGICGGAIATLGSNRNTHQFEEQRNRDVRIDRDEDKVRRIRRTIFPNCN